MKRLLEAIANRFPCKVLYDREGGEPYLKRFKLLSIPWFGSHVRLYLHQILAEDSTFDYHDHPFGFFQCILWGGYEEEVPVFVAHGEYRRKFNRLRPGSIRLRKPEFTHRVGHLNKGESWSLVIRGPRVREWGFCGHLNGEWTWTHWKEYIERYRGGYYGIE